MFNSDPPEFRWVISVYKFDFYTVNWPAQCINWMEVKIIVIDISIVSPYNRSKKNDKGGRYVFLRQA